MRNWLHRSVEGSSIGNSAATSVVVHVVLIGAAVYSTGASARQLTERMADRTSFLHYLPPPDRRPSPTNAAEHVRFMAIGANGPVIPKRPDGRVLSPAGSNKVKHVAGDLGTDAGSQAETQKVESPDSVYSMLNVEESVERTAASAAPIYPPALMTEGTEGGVVVRFVVDSAGRADTGSFEVIRSTHPAFTQSVREALPLMLFIPARIRGRHVRQLVEQDFEFRITPAPAAAHALKSPVP